MSDPVAEYTVRDYSAFDEQVRQIGLREEVLTEKLRVQNFKQRSIVVAGLLLAVGVFVLLLSIAYRIAFPSLPEIIETVKVVEKPVEPARIIIETPKGTKTGEESHDATSRNSASQEAQGTAESGSINVNNRATKIAVAEATKRMASEGVTIGETGVTISLQWNNRSDLDLFVTEPGGDIVSYTNKRTGTGGKLDIDANAYKNMRTHSPVENISWQKGRAPKGTYQVSVGYYSKDETLPNEGKTSYKVVIGLGHSQRLIRGTFKNSDTKKKRIVGTFTVD